MVKMGNIRYEAWMCSDPHDVEYVVIALRHRVLITDGTKDTWQHMRSTAAIEIGVPADIKEKYRGYVLVKAWYTVHAHTLTDAVNAIIEKTYEHVQRGDNINIFFYIDVPGENLIVPSYTLDNLEEPM